VRLSRQFIKNSLPAKCAAYMAARHCFAHVVSEPDLEQLATSDAAVDRAKGHYDMKSEPIRVWRLFCDAAAHNQLQEHA